MTYDFFNNDRALITAMVQAKTPERTKELIDIAIPQGAEAFGMQFEHFSNEFKTKSTYRDLFTYAKGMPIYATNYRNQKNTGKSDEELAEELIFIAECGADLCDVMGDYFDKQPDEVAVCNSAIERQKQLIDELHKKGSKTLMSSHVLKYTPAERVLNIALQHQNVGADISKIVTYAETQEEQLENLKIINLLKENLNIPFLFLCGGKCGLLRRIGGELGCCMYLCVPEYDELATPQQPLIKDVKTLRNIIKVKD